MTGPTIGEVVAGIRRSMLYWAPEMRVNKLLPYLEAYGEPLRVALMALPAAERETCGVDKIKVARR